MTLTYPENDRALQVDRLHAAMAKMPPAEMPLTHRFTPGLYVREIFMPKGTLIISKIHKTEHPYVITKGRVAVWIDGRVEQLTAPHVGVTKPGTRRVLFIHEDCTWLTFHPTNETNLEKIEEQVIEPRTIGPEVEIDATIIRELTA